MPIKLQSPRRAKPQGVKKLTQKVGVRSPLEKELALCIKLAGIPEPVEEYQFHPFRQWRFDFAFPGALVAIECEGGIWSKKKSRHTTGKGFEEDCVKYNEAAALGWKVLRFTGNQIKSGYATAMIKKVLLGE